LRASGCALPRLTVETTSFHLRSELLASGRFLTVVPAFSLKLPHRHTSLRALPVELTIAPDRAAIVTVTGRSVSPLAQLFIDRVRAITTPLAKP
jgi:DNA-binding transcriptional LysR family regulator